MYRICTLSTKRKTEFLFSSFVSLLLVDWWVTLDRLDIKKYLNLGWDRPQVAKKDVFNVPADAKHRPKLTLTISNTRNHCVCLNYWFINIAPRLGINSRLLRSRKVLWVWMRSTSGCKAKGFQRACRCQALPRIACSNPKYKENMCLLGIWAIFPKLQTQETFSSIWT